jgi:antagonist of KipI
LPFDIVCRTEFAVSRHLDRVGIRLEPEEALRHEIELPSEPATVGAIQVTPDGTPILLGPDGPTIGGYPKIGVVIRADVPLMGQLRPGGKLRFEAVSTEEARRIDREASESLGRNIATWTRGEQTTKDL